MTIDTSAEQLKKNYFWNTLGSLMNAASTVLMLMVVTRTMGAAAGGVFSLAYAVAQQSLVTLKLGRIRLPIQKKYSRLAYILRHESSQLV